ncbi:ftsJ-like methyltransferase family protein [Artemisia annua]|uniref:FtsJ-like methyltransferase family protein n=1 Tax=Artemisia annua TaxID=35608 RepID=A0A2U1PVT3_ARTAN|nr:ftsJ-like methyltransferase family protein [Artemisia annua]
MVFVQHQYKVAMLFAPLPSSSNSTNLPNSSDHENQQYQNPKSKLTNRIQSIQFSDEIWGHRFNVVKNRKQNLKNTGGLICKFKKKHQHSVAMVFVQHQYKVAMVFAPLPSSSNSTNLPNSSDHENQQYQNPKSKLTNRIQSIQFSDEIWGHRFNVVKNRVKALCKDLHVLRKQSFKHLLKWHIHMRKAFSSEKEFCIPKDVEPESKVDEDEDGQWTLRNGTQIQIDLVLCASWPFLISMGRSKCGKLMNDSLEVYGLIAHFMEVYKMNNYPQAYENIFYKINGSSK